MSDTKATSSSPNDYWRMIAAAALSLTIGGAGGTVITQTSDTQLAATRAAVAHNTALLTEVRAEQSKFRDELIERTADRVYRAEFKELEQRVRSLEAAQR
jgi:hypothetical protein